MNMAVLAKIIVSFDQNDRKVWKNYANSCAESRYDGAAELGANGCPELSSTYGNRFGDPVLSPPKGLSRLDCYAADTST